LNLKQSREIRGLLIIAGALTSNAVHLFGSVKAFVATIFVALRATALAAQKRTLKNMQFMSTTRVAEGRGIGLIVEIIFLAISIYVIAFILPGALTAISTTALTSVNAGVIVMFQVLVPLIAIVVVILLLISIVRRAVRAD
jgi:hypothetical protein